MISNFKRQDFFYLIEETLETEKEKLSLETIATLDYWLDTFELHNNLERISHLEFLNELISFLVNVHLKDINETSKNNESKEILNNKN